MSIHLLLGAKRTNLLSFAKFNKTFTRESLQPKHTHGAQLRKDKGIMLI